MAPSASLFASRATRNTSSAVRPTAPGPPSRRRTSWYPWRTASLFSGFKSPATSCAIRSGVASVLDELRHDAPIRNDVG